MTTAKYMTLSLVDNERALRFRMSLEDVAGLANALTMAVSQAKASPSMCPDIYQRVDLLPEFEKRTPLNDMVINYNPTPTPFNESKT